MTVSAVVNAGAASRNESEPRATTVVATEYVPVSNMSAPSPTLRSVPFSPVASPIDWVTSSSQPAVSTVNPFAPTVNESRE